MAFFYWVYRGDELLRPAMMLEYGQQTIPAS